MADLGSGHPRFIIGHSTAGAGDVLHPSTAPGSSTPTVGVTHGRGPQLITGPLPTQTYPLQNPTEISTRDTSAASPETHVFQPVARDRSSTGESQNANPLTPAQQAFVDRIEAKIKRERGIENHLETQPGDAGAFPTTEARHASKPSPEQTEWVPAYVPYSENQPPAFPPEGSYRTETNEMRPVSPSGPVTALNSTEPDIG